MAAIPGYLNLVGTAADDVTYFVGSLFFTTASFVQLRLTGRRVPGTWRSAGWSDWWAAAIQFVGTLFFNVTTFVAMLPNLSVTQEEKHVWRPDAIGSLCFLVASILACHATSIRDRLWDPTSRTWDVAWLNLVGSVAFGVSAVASKIVSDSGEVRNAQWVNLGTFIGAVCFFAGAILMRPDPGPEVRRGVPREAQAESG